MEDTPSNYNMANQRFEHLRDAAIDNDVEQIEEVESDSDLGGDISMQGGMELRKKKRRKKRKLYQKYEYYVEPGMKDKKMARAYGG